MATHL